MLDKTLRYYIAGPMTGYPQFNVPLFDKVATQLRKDGLNVTSPAELDSAPMRALALASETGDVRDVISEGTWGDCLARDVKMLADELDAIILLPKWEASRGAILEAFVGLLCGAEFFVWITGDPGYLISMTNSWVAGNLQDALFDRHIA